MMFERLVLLWQKPHRLKYQRRVGLIAANSLNNLLPMFFTPIISLLVIRQSSTAVWGAFVGVMITINLGAMLVGWGNQEYLLREFTRQPTQVNVLWQTSLRTRLVLGIGVAILCMVLYAPMAGWILLWMTALVLQQSCTVLVTYRRSFVWASAVELAGIVLMLVALLGWGTAVTPERLIQLIALVTAVKAVAMLLYFRDTVGVRHGRFDAHYFLLAFPFFLLGFSGMLNSRADLYLVNLFLPKTDVGQYQVFSTFLLYLQAVSAIILRPYIKTLYRMPHQVIRRLSLSLLGLGCLIVPPGMILLSFLLSSLYQIHLSPLFFIIGGLSVLPIFYVLPTIYLLYKANQQITVLKINLFSILLVTLLNWALLPSLGLIGVVIASGLTRWLILLIYRWQGKKQLW